MRFPGTTLAEVLAALRKDRPWFLANRRAWVAATP
jgi:hypothetical protein